MSARSPSDRLGAALVRLLFNSVADGNHCTCAVGDRCPECEAMLALGFGRWKGAKSAQVKLAKLATRRGWRIM